MTISTRLHQPWLVLMTLFALFIGLSACGPGSGESPDEEPPTLEITDGPEEVTTDSAASFSLRCNRDEGCDFECALDGRQFQSCQSPVTYDSLDDGQHFFEARATDADGRRSDVAIWEWTIDSAPPEIKDLTGPQEATNASDAEFEFSCTKDNCEFFCAIDGQTSSQCESPTTYDELADGDHIFSVYAVDDLGTEGPPAQWEWAIDTEEPTVEFSQTPPALTSSSEAQFSYFCSKDNCDFECHLDDQDFETCPDTITFNDLDDGDHHFQVRAIDEFGTQGPQTQWEWTIDNTNPLADDLEGPDDFTSETSATFDFACSKDECTFECQLDNGGYAPCQPGQTYDNLDDGPHQFSVVATDDLDNTGPTAQWEWTVDTQAPAIENLSGPGEFTNSTSVTIDFECSEEDCEFECDFSENDAPESCTSGVAYHNLDDGPYDFALRATDRAGNHSDWEPLTWTVDTVDPEIAITNAPPAQSGESTPTISFECTNEISCDFECALHVDGNSGTWQACTSPHQLSITDAGDYEFAVRATDGAGNQSETSATWTQFIGWAQVAAGSQHTCATTTDGRLYCWGRNDYGNLGTGDLDDRITPTQIGDQTQWLKVSVGHEFSCAIDSENQLWCWGDNLYDQLGLDGGGDRDTPAKVGEASNWRDLSAGYRGACALRDDDTLWCWGEGFLGNDGTASSPTPQQIGVGPSWKSLSLTFHHACLRDSDDHLWCWGDNYRGQLGTGDNEERDMPTQVGSDNDWSAISAGRRHTCGRRHDGSLWCSGANNYGQLGTGDTESRNTFQEVSSSTSWNALVGSGSRHTCAIDDAQQLWCWGSGHLGRLGHSELSNSLTPRAAESSRNWTQLSVAREHSCAIDDLGQMYCWGGNVDKQIGFYDPDLQSLPVAVDSSRSFSELSTAGRSACAIADDGTLWCWGNNQNGELGLGDDFLRQRPEQVGAADDWIAIAGGGDHHCAIRADDSLWCWGKNNNYELGLGDDESRYEPVEIDFGVGVIDVAASSDHTCAIGTDNSLWCWGRNHDGSLGTGDFDPREMPTEIDGPNNWVELAALGTSTCGLRDDGTIWCWGEGPKVDNFYGPVVTNSPTQVGEDSNWQALIGMPEEPAFLTTPAPIYCGLRTDNTLWCWGGDITWDGEPPAQIGSDDDWKRLAETSHGSHTCAIRNDDSLWCWGSNSAGQLGTGDTTYTPDPAPVDSTDTFSAVATGTNFSVALDASGSLWSFGENADGKLGTGTLYFSVPEQIELP